MNIPDRLQALRGQMIRNNVQAYIVTGTDPHESEYLPDHWQTRAWISGFTGSAGLVVITLQGAGLWTDGRYHLQAQSEIADSGITLFKEGLPGVLTPLEYLKKELQQADRIGIDTSTTSWQKKALWQENLTPAGLVIAPLHDLIGEIWLDRPPLPHSEVWDFESVFSDVPRSQKIAQIRQALQREDADSLLLSSLDDIAWTTGLRGGDVAYNPVFLSYLLICKDKTVLFIRQDRIQQRTIQTLAEDQILIAPYEDLTRALEQLGETRIWLAPDKTSVKTILALQKSKLLLKPSPTTLAKALKTPQELDALRRAMINDGKALVRFLAWWDENAPSQTLTEIGAAQKLLEFRRQGPGFAGESFAPIAAFGPSGAVIHYKAEPATQRKIEGRGLFLLDTGAQYYDGTTDITRTLVLGTPHSEEIEDYTLVLRAHIHLATAQFPQGTRGYSLDAQTRDVLWRAGRNYNHGTGHGVGHFLCVHEGPQRISSDPNTQTLELGMVCSNEPGLYRSERYGIRLENLIVVTASQKTVFAQFYEMETLTLCPFERRLIDRKTLQNDELAWLNSYHERVYQLLGAELPPRERAWLKEKTRPI